MGRLLKKTLREFLTVDSFFKDIYKKQKSKSCWENSRNYYNYYVYNKLNDSSIGKVAWA